MEPTRVFGNARTAAAQEEVEETNLMCPICEETMVTLLQLNRHLDDVHSEVEKVDNEPLKSWFLKKVEKAKQLQTVTSVFQTKLDLFDQDDSDSQNSSTMTHSRTPSLTDEFVTRKHWQKHGDRCSDLLCDKLLNGRNGSVNCRQCGKLFCSEHTMYKMKLSRRAKHDPSVNGIWCRVCETCFKSRQGYSDNSGTFRTLTDEFNKLRQEKLDVRQLEVNRLEKRMSKLVTLLEPYCDDSGLLNYPRIQKRKQLERSVANWQDDNDVVACPICQNRFGYSLRKHHCRACGKVVCASHSTECSKDVQLSVLDEKLNKGMAHVPLQSDISVRICRDCKDIVFSKQNFQAELNSPKPQVLKYFETLERIRKSIELVFPKFQAMLVSINDSPSHEDIQEAASIRKKLMDLFYQYDSVARKLISCPVNNESEKRLRHQFHAMSSSFLQEHMLPLKTVPKVLKHEQPNSRSSSPSLDESTINSLREQQTVLNEQRSVLQDMIASAKSKRRYDEIQPLEQSLSEIVSEVSRIQSKLDNID
ncbi:hypothetical protein TRICI_000394 [Trichomonascus ciferrii]|uniref:FYVE-type domain-containing protein n=1 Tax=Trichomonascus ciferrii TaxID=44093 RepID=A0A642VDI5_9ASCO|nr:hypothetical protein TRICI_000394 [Trichomonascus ciferrii]